MDSSDSNLLKLDFKHSMFAEIELNFTWYSKISAIVSSLLIFVRAASVSDMVKQHNWRLLTKNFCCSLKNIRSLRQSPINVTKSAGNWLIDFQFKDCTRFDMVRRIDRWKLGLGISYLTFRKVKPSKESAICDHLLICSNIQSCDQVITTLACGHIEKQSNDLFYKIILEYLFC